ncbi:hypothetical protein PENSPDRAFT_569119 [Peniophora sp. CONT]|nr:hypothetical protein PENSPDRAFT_569119 [Peniophora sp. CONT]
MSLAKLTAISTSTLSLLLERQRLQTLPQYTTQTSNPLHLPQITKNLRQLKAGILALEAKEGRTEAVTLLRSQYGRMRGMLGEDADRAGIEVLEEPKVEEERDLSPGIVKTHTRSRSSSTEPIYTPYADDPEAGPEPGVLLQEQQRLMDDQDMRLDTLAQSIGRQRDISLRINDEIGTHQGLLEELDHDLDTTSNNLGRARRQLGTFAQKAKANGSTLTIAGLIFVLLILIIVFKT